MVDSYAETESRRIALVEVYRQCPALEQDMLRLVSIAYEPVSSSALLDCLNLVRLDGNYQQLLSAPALTPHLDHLLALKLLQRDNAKRLCCHPLLVEIASRDAVQQGQFDSMVGAVEERLPVETAPWNPEFRYFSGQEQLLREIRIGLYRENWPFVKQQLSAYAQFTLPSQRLSLDDIICRVYTNPLDRDWLSRLSGYPELYEFALASILNDSMMALRPAPVAFELLNQVCTDATRPFSAPQGQLWVEQLLLRGQWQAAEAALQRLGAVDPDAVELFQGWIAFLQGDIDQTISAGNKVLKERRQGQSQGCIDSLSGVFLVLALLQQRSPQGLQQGLHYATAIASQDDHWLAGVYDRLESVLRISLGDLAAREVVLELPMPPLQAENSIETLVSALCLYWIDLDAAEQRLPSLLHDVYQRAQTAGYHWLAREAAELLERLNADGDYLASLTPGRQSGPSHCLAAVMSPQQAWELSLEALIALNSEEATGSGSAIADLRLAWFISLYPGGDYGLQPKEQRITKRGTWSKGRVVSLRRLAEERSSFNYLTPQDLQVLAHLVVEDSSYRYYGQRHYRLDHRAILALVGHPLVFWEEAAPGQVEVVAGVPELLVQQSRDGWLSLTLSPALVDKRQVLLVKETPTRLKVYEPAPQHRRIAEILGPNNCLDVPESAQERVLSAINAVSGVVTIHSDIGGGLADAAMVPADTTPHMHLLPAGEGLKVALLMRPFCQGGPYYRPGVGGEMVVAEVNGTRLQTTRPLDEERNRAQAVLEQCPTLYRWEQTEGEWWIEDPQECLELLWELQQIAEQVVLAWPQGEPFRIARQAGLNHFQLRLQQQQDWFMASGELAIDDQRVLDMQQLLALLQESPGRFVPLEDGSFLALTQEFRKRLEDLRTFSEGQGRTLRLHPLAALTMDDWIDDVGQLQADQAWKDHIQRLRTLPDLQPQLPSTLQAELRDYQLEGFRWLARLAHWGVGACLADDMGLGKTLQALAVILTRAPQGPTLVVAPTSVCFNWIAEAQTFAPTLKPLQLGSGDRQRLLDNLQPFDLLVCSYGLLQQDDVATKLAAICWQTIVLDEAQAIKNVATKRSKAAMALQGGFKLITTGTPIENHLGELWNLFRFINPGLLGSLDRFQQTFAYPIERQQDSATRQRLRRLIQPFILRRTKSQVLRELPSRTEITLQVELSRDEMAFYEALRRDAIATLSQSDATAGTKHLQVLAEITRLRRACCNARLVSPETALPSAKLDALAEVLEELLSNQHKALVFSQFVDHLTILRQYLEAKAISYQYLDGSTPNKERQRRVEAFQAGQGDVFLISLKAGGTGLNLTAADYVIHMDPWWNPAVEDQASDRAHRIGQRRPVTIYRLVAKGTLEEKIVDLHCRKRELADSLLDGADMSGKMSTEDLMRLIRDT